ncbi:MAG TPA: long-chain-fatty-acid--CoA ligase [Chloroflexota bacterium]|nr:long-chain-fatty-acid--CoA ligase [Chloroflexota bacterium]
MPARLRLHDFLDYWAGRQPQAEFAVQGERRLTYRQAQRETNRLANAFGAAGLGPGDRLAILARNCIEYPLLYLAASRAGVVPVPLNYRAAPPEWRFVVNDAGARMIIAGGPYLEQIDALRQELEPVRHYLALGPSPAPSGWEALQRWAGPHSGAAPRHDVDPQCDLYQVYTSGTTGEPKGALLTQQAVVANLLQIGHTAHRAPRPGERSLVLGPMLHAGVVWTALAPLSWGASLYIQDEFDPEEVVRALSEERIGYAALVPAVLQACLAAVPDARWRPYPSLRLIHTGSAAVSEETLIGAREAFGCDVVQGYGLTEGTAGLTAMEPADYESELTGGGDGERARAVGRPLLGTELRIVDEHDRPLPPGAAGEIVARGPQLMRGYWNRPQATAEALRGGWLHTGDVGVLDGEGFLTIRDRLKDVIVTGGSKVYPRMVEQVLREHPAVADVAVIGVPDARWGESVKAVVVLRPGATAGGPDLLDACRGKLGGFQRPRSVDFVTSLPRTATGKVRKAVLRAPYWAGRARRVGES